MAAIDFGKKVGPLPLGAWVVVVVVGLGISYYTKTSSSSSEPTETISTGGDPGVGTGEVGGWVSTGSGVSYPSIVTNEDWAYRAKTELMALGYPAADVDNAVNKYVAGVTLSVSEKALIAVALTRIGPMPQTLPPVENPPTTGGQSTPPPNPTGLKVTSVTGTTVGLSWNRTTGANKYIIYMNKTGQKPVVSVTTSGTTPTYRWAGLNRKTRYSFSVSAVNSAGVRSPATSSVVRVTTK